jgi:hypothetical protein
MFGSKKLWNKIKGTQKSFAYLCIIHTSAELLQYPAAGRLQHLASAKGRSAAPEKKFSSGQFSILISFYWLDKIGIAVMDDYNPQYIR